MNASNPKAYTLRGCEARPTTLASPLPLAPVEDKAPLVDLEGGRLASDGGLLLRNDPDDHLGFTRHVAAVLRDRRAPRRVDVTLHDLRKPRGWHLAAGEEAAHAATTLRDAPLVKWLRGRRPESGPPWAAPPTVARFANRVARPALSRLARGLVEPCLASYTRPPTLIVLDVDAPEAPAHGQQEPLRDEG